MGRNSDKRLARRGVSATAVASPGKKALRRDERIARATGLVKKRVVVDTNAIRDVVDGTRSGPRFHELAAFKDVVSIHLSDTSLLEITLQVARGTIDFEAWREACPALVAVIDDDEPVIHAEDPFSRAEPKHPAVARAERQVSWRRLTTSPTLAAFIAPFAMQIGPVLVEQGALRQADTEERLRDDHQAKWAGYIERVSAEFAKRGLKPSSQEVFDAILADARGNFPGGEARVWKYEAYVRAIARFVSLNLTKGSQYLPAKERGQNDMLDIKLLSMLAVADFIITEEKKLVAHLAQSGSKDAARLLSVGELLARAATWHSG